VVFHNLTARHFMQWSMPDQIPQLW
jgi:hypothetical protein